MRTTLTLDDDVALALEQLRHDRQVSLKQLVNDALRAGLDRLRAPKDKIRSRYRTEPWDLGDTRIKNLDCASEVMAIVEDENFK